MIGMIEPYLRLLTIRINSLRTFPGEGKAQGGLGKRTRPLPDPSFSALVSLTLALLIDRQAAFQRYNLKI